jgi:hypothetical protein
MLDEQDGVLAAQAAQERHHARRFFRSHASSGFIEQEQFRGGSQSHGDFELALFTV